MNLHRNNNKKTSDWQSMVMHIYASSAWITDVNGSAVQHLQYLPFGEDFVSQSSTAFDARYKFSGKEKDSETGYSYFGARYYSSDLSVWLSVDPLADKYPSMSPFMYTAGNPVMLVDPDGMRIRIREKNGTGWFGRRKNLTYKDGKLYEGLFGRKEYTGGDKFANGVKDDLNTIKGYGDYENDIIKTLEKSKHTHTFLWTAGDNGGNRKWKNKITAHKIRNGKGASSIMNLNRNDGFLEDGDRKIIKTSVTSLAHELSHIFEYDTGIYSGKGVKVTMFDGSETWPSPALPHTEVNAVRFENLIRSKMKVDLRRTYILDGVKNVPQYDLLVPIK